MVLIQYAHLIFGHANHRACIRISGCALRDGSRASVSVQTAAYPAAARGERALSSRNAAGAVNHGKPDLRPATPKRPPRPTRSSRSHRNLGTD
jgi:hypothetical protein